MARKWIMSSDELGEQMADEVATDWREVEDKIPVSRAVRALLHRRRRRIVRFLMDHPDELTTTDEVVEAVRTAEDQSGPPERSRPDAEIDVTCIQLPHLAAAGVIDYDADAGRVRYHSNPRIELLVECIEGL